MFGELILNDVQEKWLGTLTSVPNKGEKVPRHAPACLIGCAAYETCLLTLMKMKCGRRHLMAFPWQPYQRHHRRHHYSK